MLNTNWKLKSALAGLTATIAVWGCSTMAPKADHYVAPPLGTTWELMRHDTGSYGAGSTKVLGRRGERRYHGEQMLTFESPGSAIVAKQSGNWVGIFNGDKPLITWDPPLTYEWPLEVGKSWTHEQRVTIHAKNATIPYSSTLKVEAYEDVTVPAGTFKAFKVSSVTTLGDENLVWFSPELGIFVKQSLKRTAKSRQGAGTRVIELLSYKRGG